METVLNTIEVAPDDPFEFAAPGFGVRVEEPSEDMRIDEPYVPDLGALINEIYTSILSSKPMDRTAVIPSTPTISLSSSLLSQDSNGNRPCISTSVFVRDSLFQQRTSMSMDNRTRETVGSIVVDLSLRSDGEVKEVVQPPNSNVVHLRFNKSMVSCYIQKRILNENCNAAD